VAVARLDMQWDVRILDARGDLLLAIPVPEWFVSPSEAEYSEAIASGDMARLRYASAVVGIQWFGDRVLAVSTRVGAPDAGTSDQAKASHGRLDLFDRVSGEAIVSLRFDSPVDLLSRSGWIAEATLDSLGFTHLELRRLSLNID
jgi:hypothetical protein